MLKERVCESGENLGSRISPCTGEVRFCTFVGIFYALLGPAGIFWGGEKVRGGATDLCASKAVVLVPSSLHVVQDDELAVYNGE